MTTTVLALGMMSGTLAAAELRFTIWTGNEAHLKMLNGYAESFKAKHPDVTVKYETIPPGDYTQKLTFQLAGGNPPDAGWLMEDAAPTFAAAGALDNLAPALKKVEVTTSRTFPSLRSACGPRATRSTGCRSRPRLS